MTQAKKQMLLIASIDVNPAMKNASASVSEVVVIDGPARVIATVKRF